MQPREMLENVETLAETLVQGAIRENISYCDLLQVVELTARLLKAQCPAHVRGEPCHLGTVAEAVLRSIDPRSWKN
jgi:hypothetical protein